MVSANAITGKKVIGVNGDAIGEVKDTEFDSASWRIKSLLLQLTDKAATELGYTRTSGSVGALSMKRGNKAVFMPVELIASIGDVITVNKTLIEIEQGQFLKRYAS
jgi:sporulation protein YlmC with PRC-barrel domain